MFQEKKLLQYKLGEEQEKALAQIKDFIKIVKIHVFLYMDLQEQVNL